MPTSRRRLSRSTSTLGVDPVHFASIRSKASLSPADEVSIGTRARQGDIEARDELVRHNLRLVVKIASRHKSQGIAIMDLIAEGNIGLIRAAESYDPTQGTRFSTYAVPWIKQAIERSVPEQHQGIALKRHAVQLARKRAKAFAMLTQQMSRIPTAEEVDDSLGLSQATRAYARDVDRVLGVKREGDATAAEERGGIDLFEFISPDAGDDLYEIDVRDAFDKAVQTLSPVELRVINLRFPTFGEPMSLIAAGKLLGHSNNWVWTVEMRALEKLKQALLDSGFSYTD